MQQAILHPNVTMLKVLIRNNCPCILCDINSYTVKIIKRKMDNVQQNKPVINFPNARTIFLMPAVMHGLEQETAFSFLSM